MSTPSYNCTTLLDSCTISFYKERSFFQADPLWTGLGFFFGLLLGAALAALCAIPCIRSYRKKKQQEEEERLMEKHGLSRHQISKLRATGDMELGDIDRKANIGLIGAQAGPGYDERKESLRNASERTRGRTREDTFLEEDEDRGLEEEEDLDEGNARDRGLVDALLQTTGEGGEAELDDQDYRESLDLENSLRRQKNRMFHGALKNFMEKLLAGGKISDDLCERVIDQNKQDLAGIIRMLSEEKKQAEEDLKKDKNLAKNPEALERELEKLHPKLVQKWLTLLGGQEKKIRHELRKEMKEDEVDAVMKRLGEEMAKVERILGDERKRQADVLQERLMRRKQLQEKLRQKDKDVDRDIEAHIENHSENLTQLQQNTNLSDKQKDEILAEYDRNVRKLKESHQTAALQQQNSLAEKLKRQRERRLAKMDAQHQRDVQSTLDRVDRQTGTGEFIQDFTALMEQQRQEKDELIEDIDATEAQAFNELKESQHAEVQKDLFEEDQKLARNLERHVSPSDVSRYLRKLEQQNEELEDRKAADRKRAQAKLKERLAQRKAKQVETDKQSEVAEEALKKQQEATVKRVLQEQVDMSNDLKEEILREHDQNMEQLNNQLQMSRMRQSKALEARLSKRKAQFAEKMQAKEAKKNLSAKEKEKLQQQLDDEYAAEKEKMAVEREAALNDLRQQLQQETEQALQDQDQRLGALIGRMQVGQARRKAIIQKQDQTIKELEEQLASKVSNGEAPVGQVDAVLKRHYNQVEDLTDKLQDVKNRQNQQLRDKLEAKRHRKAQELERKLYDEEARDQDTIRNRAQAHFTAASMMMMKSMMEQRHRTAMQDLEKEMEQELQKQKEMLDEQLNDELQQELQAQRTQLLAHLAAISSLSKKEVDDAVHNAVENTGGDEASARKLAKELRHGLAKAKSTLDPEDLRRPAYDEREKSTFDDGYAPRRSRNSMAGMEDDDEYGRSRASSSRHTTYDDY